MTAPFSLFNSVLVNFSHTHSSLNTHILTSAFVPMMFSLDLINISKRRIHFSWWKIDCSLKVIIKKVFILSSFRKSAHLSLLKVFVLSDKEFQESAWATENCDRQCIDQSVCINWENNPLISALLYYSYWWDDCLHQRLETNLVYQSLHFDSKCYLRD